MGAEIWIFAAAVAVLAGVIKGVVGFAMPMVMISGLATVLPPDLALAVLILPTMATNVWQALRNGVAEAVASARVHWRYLLVLWVMILFSAQLINVFSDTVVLLILGIPVTLFAVLQLIGWRLRFPASARRRVEVAIASFAGFIGGLSGVWGPPTVAYLTALETPKVEQVRVQGIVYGSGAVMLMGAHIQSGILNLQTAPISAAMLLPALAGLAIGFRIQDRLDQEKFRTATLLVLIVAGLNLIRRALMG